MGQNNMSTIILGIETSSDACSVAIYTSDKIFGNIVVQPQAHSKLLLAMVDDVLAEAGISLPDVTAFAFGSGPGSFTGVRIAASVIQGLAFGGNKPVIAISSLQALAQQAFNQYGNHNILALIDARMQEIYCGYYQVNSHGIVEPIMGDSLLRPEQLKIADTTPYLVVGSGVKTYAEEIVKNNPHLIMNDSIEHPRAHEIVQLAAIQFALGNVSPASDARPTYLRNDVAKKKDKKNPD